MVTNLTTGNFKASIHGKPVRFISVTAVAPECVMILLDSSGSMTTHRREWHAYIAVARDLIDRLPSQSLVGLAIFNVKLQETIPPSSDLQRLRNELIALQAGARTLKGKTALWDALYEVSSQFEIHQGGGVIYLLTDGRDNASKISTSRVRTQLLEKQIRVFAFTLLDPTGQHIPEVQSEELSFQGFVEGTGGSAVSIPSDRIGHLRTPTDKSGKVTEEEMQLSEQFSQVASFNRVEMQFPALVEKEQDWELKIIGLPTHNLKVVYPQRLTRCAESARGAATDR
ncbi:MAG: vWA domain-containing protein [Candidatus Acidiferrales bacterium]